MFYAQDVPSPYLQALVNVLHGPTPAARGGFRPPPGFIPPAQPGPVAHPVLQQVPQPAQVGYPPQPALQPQPQPQPAQPGGFRPAPIGGPVGPGGIAQQGGQLTPLHRLLLAHLGGY
jgi:hypothetical protein